MKSTMGKTFFAVMEIVLLVFGGSVQIYANEPEVSYEQQVIESEIIGTVEAYYNYVNNGEIDSAFRLYSAELYEYVQSMLNNADAMRKHEGIYNISSVEVCSVIPLISVNSNSTAAFVKCNINAYRSDKYYLNGTNYFLFYLVRRGDRIEISNIEIPSYQEIKTYENDEQELLKYSSIRNKLIFGDGMRLFSMDSPKYCDRIDNPQRIRVKVNNNIETMDFKTYLLRVAAAEFNSNLSCYEGYKVCAMASKMLALHRVLTVASGANYDIIAGKEQCYDATKPLSTKAKNAVNDVYNYFLIDTYGAVFPTFYRTNASYYPRYCVQNGGILPQSEASQLAATRGWEYVLKYYYTRVPNVKYYIDDMTIGNLFISSAHYHDWSRGRECPYCGAAPRSSN